MRPTVAHTANSRSAFTLIELSLVLVIIGLIIGGLLAGQELLQQAKLRKVITEVQQYNTAVNAFRLTYNALPGDMKDAYNIWGAPCGTNNNHPQTGCNGDGDRTWIGASGSSQFDYGDGRRAWQHLSLAEVISNDWPGGAPGSTTVPGSNVPRTPLGGDSMWTFVYRGGNALRLSAPRPPPDTPHFQGTWDAVRVHDAFAIDMKMDDGHAQTGRVIPADGSTPPSQCILNGDYRMAGNNIECMMFFTSF
jgi:prepilin-type N-terminal cleavage/methylation domain-containing protein